jgi:uncharacterized membrane protein YkoI
MRVWLRSAILATLAAVAILGSAFIPARADDDDAGRVRQAVEKGEIRPLSEILAVTREKLPGDVIGVEIEREDGRWRYELKVIDDQGHLFEVYVNAQSAVVERIKEK